MFLNQLEFQRYIQASAKRANLSVEWKDGAVPHTTGKKVVLPKLGASASELDYRKQLHYANHEVNHVLHTDFEAFKKVKCDATRSFLGYIWNGLEDARIEWLGGKEYEGDRSNGDAVYPSLMKKGIDSLKRATTEQKAESKQLLDQVLPLISFVNEAQGELYSSPGALAPELESVMSTEAKAYVDKLKSGDYLEVLRNIRQIENPEKGTMATFELAKRIFDEVFGFDSKKELEQLQQQGQSGGGKGQPQPKQKGEGKAKAKPKDKGEKGEGKGKGKGDKADDKKDDGDGEGDRKGEKGKGESESDRADGRDDSSESVEREPDGSRPVEANYQEFLGTTHEMADPEDRSAPGRDMHINYDDENDSSEQYVPATKDEFQVGDFCKQQFTHPDLADGSLGYETMIQEALADTSGAAFASRVRTRLQIRSRDRYEQGVKRGRLQNSLLHRVTIPDAHELNQRVFKRRIQNDTLDTAVIWLGDASGSMGGLKYACMTAACIQFNEAVGNVIGIPIEIHTFSDHGSMPLMYVHRDFATRRLSQVELTRRMCIAANRMRSNPDGDAIMWSFDRLRRAKAKRKLLIVGSDGQPSCGRAGDIDWYTRQVVKEIQDNKLVEIVGIGIMDDNVSRIYREHYVINRASELEQALLALIDKKVR